MHTEVRQISVKTSTCKTENDVKGVMLITDMGIGDENLTDLAQNRV
jgi:hypothetical protein